MHRVRDHMTAIRRATVVWQAQGIIMARMVMSVDESMAYLRNRATTMGRDVGDVASEIVGDLEARSSGRLGGPFA
jgi:AmiR/NasT family two-component response regulator